MEDDDLPIAQVGGDDPGDVGVGRGRDHDHDHVGMSQGFAHVRCDSRQAGEAAWSTGIALQVQSGTGLDGSDVIRRAIV